MSEATMRVQRETPALVFEDHMPMDPVEPTMAQNLTWALRYLKHESVLWREKGEARPMLEYIIELIAKRHGLTLQE